MLNGVNDSPEVAQELGALIVGRNMIVNLIPWNPVYSPGMQFEAPGTQRVRMHLNVTCTMFRPCATLQTQL